MLGEGRVAGPDNINDAILSELQYTTVPPDFQLDISFWDIELPTDIRYCIARKVDFFIEQAAPVILS